MLYEKSLPKKDRLSESKEDDVEIIFIKDAVICTLLLCSTF